MSQIVRKFIADQAIDNSKVSNTAAIAYSKLNLTNSIVDADINAAAAIAYSKLNLSASVQDTDMNSGAATAGFVLTADGAGGATYAAAGSSGANTSLSNLTTTSINQTLLPDGDLTRSIGSLTLRWLNLFVGFINSGTSNLVAQSATLNTGVSTGDVTLKSGNFGGAASTGNSGVLTLASGDVAGTGTSGNVILKTGSGVNGTSGDITIESGTSLAGRGDVTILGDTINLNADNAISANSKQIHNVQDPSSAQDAATKAYVDAAIVSSTPSKETFVLSGTDITNQYIDLAAVAKTDSILFMVKGSGNLLEGASYDYSVSYTGGAGGNTRITFLNDLATGGVAALVATDVVQVNYIS